MFVFCGMMPRYYSFLFFLILKDYKRRDELMGGGSSVVGGKIRGSSRDAASASPGIISTDPGLSDTPFHGSATSSPVLGGDTRNNAPEGESEGSLLMVAGGDSEGREEGMGVGAGARGRREGGRGRGEGERSPGRVPLKERPHRHRKYYKVRRDGAGAVEHMQVRS